MSHTQYGIAWRDEEEDPPGTWRGPMSRYGSFILDRQAADRWLNDVIRANGDRSPLKFKLVDRTVSDWRDS